MTEKTKKLIIIVFTAIVSLAVSVVATMLGVPAEELIPTDIIDIPPAITATVAQENPQNIAAAQSENSYTVCVSLSER
ncbi:MAG: hypothetical protein RSB09_00535 [Clostridia bacterium]